jgi:hypothetical protein
MAGPPEIRDSGAEIPQFERAEFAAEDAGGPFCRKCRLPLQDEYYDVGGNVICPACLAESERPRARFLRALRAFLYGSFAAGVGAAIYRMVMFGTGWNFAIVAIVVGYVVGGAVMTGSGDRGGRFYQFLAVFLTYSALVGMFVPDAWQAIVKGWRNRQEAAKEIKRGAMEQPKNDPGGKARAEPAADPDPKKTEARAAVGPKPGARPEADTKPGEADAKVRPGPVREKPPIPHALALVYLAGVLLLMFLLLIGFMYTIPIRLGLSSPISLLIFGFALWQAWKMTGARDMTVTGPYRVRG